MIAASRTAAHGPRVEDSDCWTIISPSPPVETSGKETSTMNAVIEQISRVSK